jgi:hypothetical protein
MTVPFPYRLHNVSMNDQTVPADVEAEWQRYAVRDIFPWEKHVHPHTYISEYALWLRKKRNLPPAGNQLVAEVENLNECSIVTYKFFV